MYLLTVLQEFLEDPCCPSVSSEAHWLPRDSSCVCYNDNKNDFLERNS